MDSSNNENQAKNQTSENCMSVDDWWECPKCGSHTETHEDPPPHRSCSTCEWSVSIPTPGET